MIKLAYAAAATILTAGPALAGIEPSVVPLPAAAPLLIGGLVAIGAVRHFRRK